MKRLYDRISKTDTCWLWTGTLDAYGYGVVSVGSKTRKAHRVVYELERGTIPDKLVCDHICRVRHCVNPEHIELVNNGVNVLRGVSNSAINKRKTHCKHGHELTPENTYTYPRGWRGCRKCRARLDVAQRAKRIS